MKCPNSGHTASANAYVKCLGCGQLVETTRHDNPRALVALIERHDLPAGYTVVNGKVRRFEK